MHFVDLNLKPVGLRVKSSLEEESSSGGSSDGSLELIKKEVGLSCIHFYLVPTTAC